jgi:hypothetical protein
MVTAEVIEMERTTEIDPTGDVVDALRPVFTLSPFSGTFRTEAIPIDEFSRDLARQRVRELAEETLDESADVNVVLPAE